MYKICFVTTISLTLKSFVLELAEFMHETGNFEIHFVCDYDAEFEKMLPQYIHYKPISMKRGVSFDGIKAILEMKKYFKKEKFDLVQYSTPNASCYASIAAKLAGVPCRLYCQWGIAYVGFQGVKRKIFKQIERMVCRNSTMIEPDSFGNLQFSHSENLYTPDKSRVIWNGSASGVNLSKFDITHKIRWREEIRRKHNIPQDAFVYIFVGRITKDKGVNELFEASKSLINTHKDVYLLLVGNVEASESVDAGLYQWTQDEDRVIYCGYTNEVEQYLAASDVYLLPSYREGFGSAVVEAEAMGVPVIVSDIPGPTDAMINGKTGILTPKADTKKLYDNMLFMYDNKELCNEYGENGKSFARTSFEQKELFRRIIEDRSSLICNNKRIK
ncbi:MAG: glycosyltransferase family 4 protein [Clostridia bacterium]|nr:glycosyltransferase family 4 protein [Clostridia bacterium]